MNQIVGLVPLHSPQRNFISIFQICIWRVFAFGEEEHIEALTLERDSLPDLDSITAVINKWGGTVKIPMTPYGQLMIEKSKVGTMLHSLWKFAEEVHNYHNTPTFAKIYQRLIARKIPAFKSGGLFVWLLSADFVEYGLCLAPTHKGMPPKHVSFLKPRREYGCIEETLTNLDPQDLACHIMPPLDESSPGSPSGPKKALEYVAKTANVEMPKDFMALAEIFRKIFEKFRNPSDNMPSLQKIVRDCEGFQGRKLNIADIEHALCKIARQIDTPRIKRQSSKGQSSKGQPSKGQLNKGRVSKARATKPQPGKVRQIKKA
jgi:hypothetical protein